MDKIYVTKPSLPPMDEYIEYVKKIWDTDILTNFGPVHEEFRKQLSEFLQTDLCMPTCNGHFALEMLIQALGVKGEVITTPFTFASTIHAIVRSGCTPVFCDIKATDCTIDPEKIEELITDKTVAILPVHVYGFPCDVEKIEKIAKKHGLKVIYDAAHAFGVEIGSKSISHYGDGSIYSFHATKAFNTIEGGCAVASDKETGIRLYQLINFGIMDEERVEYVGANAKMNEFEAAMGICNLRHFHDDVIKRKVLHDIYKEKLSHIAGVSLLNPDCKDVKRNYSYCPVIVDERIVGKTRDDVYNCLTEQGIYARKYFFPIANEFTCYREKGYKGNTPIAHSISERVLTLPLYSDLTSENVIRICDILENYLGRQDVL